MEIKEIRPTGKGASLSTRPSKQLQIWLVQRLATLAMARQAAVDAETFKFFAQSLSNFLQTDLDRAIEKLCHTKRAEGETAFPDLPTLEEAIISERNKRWNKEEELGRSEEARHFEEHPEEYISVSEIFKIVRERRAAAGKPVPELLKPGRRMARAGQ